MTRLGLSSLCFARLGSSRPARPGAPRIGLVRQARLASQCMVSRREARPATHGESSRGEASCRIVRRGGRGSSRMARQGTSSLHSARCGWLGERRRGPSTLGEAGAASPGLPRSGPAVLASHASALLVSARLAARGKARSVTVTRRCAGHARLVVSRFVNDRRGDTRQATLVGLGLVSASHGSYSARPARRVGAKRVIALQGWAAKAGWGLAIQCMSMFGKAGALRRGSARRALVSHGRSRQAGRVTVRQGSALRVFAAHGLAGVLRQVNAGNGRLGQSRLVPVRHRNARHGMAGTLGMVVLVSVGIGTAGAVSLGCARIGYARQDRLVTEWRRSARHCIATLGGAGEATLCTARSVSVRQARIVSAMQGEVWLGQAGKVTQCTPCLGAACLGGAGRASRSNVTLVVVGRRRGRHGQVCPGVVAHGSEWQARRGKERSGPSWLRVARHRMVTHGPAGVVSEGKASYARARHGWLEGA